MAVGLLYPRKARIGSSRDWGGGPEEELPFSMDLGDREKGPKALELSQSSEGIYLP